MKEMKVTLRTLTPLWTGDAWGKSDKPKLTGIIGSLRWWFEALVRGMGYNACNSTPDNKCKIEIKNPEDVVKVHKQICPVCYLFGTTGWENRFSVDIESNDLKKLYDGKVIVKINEDRGWHYESGLTGNVILNFRYEDMFIGKKDKDLTMDQVFPSILKILLYLISEYGMLGAKTSMGYGVVKFQIDDKDIQITEDDWKNFETFLSMFPQKNIKNLPNLKDMFFIKFGVKSDVSQLVNNMKQFYTYQDGIVEGDVDKWKDNGWGITSPVVRKCLRCIFRGKYSEKVCGINRNCDRNYWWVKNQSIEKPNRNYTQSKSIDFLNLSKNESKNLRHFLMGSTSEPEYSAIQVSHMYTDDDNLEFRIWGWLPDIRPINSNVRGILQLLSSVFNETPWNVNLPSSIQDGICWASGSLGKIEDKIKQLFIVDGENHV